MNVYGPITKATHDANQSFELSEIAENAKLANSLFTKKENVSPADQKMATFVNEFKQGQLMKVREELGNEIKRDINVINTDWHKISGITNKFVKALAYIGYIFAVIFTAGIYLGVDLSRKTPFTKEMKKDLSDSMIQKEEVMKSVKEGVTLKDGVKNELFYNYKEDMDAPAELKSHKDDERLARLKAEITIANKMGEATPEQIKEAKELLQNFDKECLSKDAENKSFYEATVKRIDAKKAKANARVEKVKARAEAVKENSDAAEKVEMPDWFKTPENYGCTPADKEAQAALVKKAALEAAEEKAALEAAEEKAALEAAAAQAAAAQAAAAQAAAAPAAPVLDTAASIDALRAASERLTAEIAQLRAAAAPQPGIFTRMYNRFFSRA